MLFNPTVQHSWSHSKVEGTHKCTMGLWTRRLLLQGVSFQSCRSCHVRTLRIRVFEVSVDILQGFVRRAVECIDWHLNEHVHRSTHPSGNRRA